VATNDFNALFRQAAVHQLPILMVVEDNGWAITAASSIQWSGSLVEWARGGGVYAEEVDGTDAIATYQASARLVEHIRSGKGPVLMHLRLGLLDPHSSSTDIKSYRTKEEIEATAATMDPVKNFGRWLIEQSYLQEGDSERIRKEIRAEVERAENAVLQEPEPTAERVMQHIVNVPTWIENTPRGAQRQLPMLGAINEALAELAKRDENFFVYGQDVGSPRGGVFGATAQLVTQFHGRAISRPLHEQLIVGIAARVGMHDHNARCTEIQLVHYNKTAAQTIRRPARLYYQSIGDWTVHLRVWVERAGQALDLLSEGLTGMKIWPFDYVAHVPGGWENWRSFRGMFDPTIRSLGGQDISASDIHRALDPFRKIRKAVGDRMDVMLEGHGLWSLPAALKIARAVEEFRPAWLEDLMRADDIGALAELQRSTTTPLLVSEYLTTRYEYKPVLEQRAAEIIMIDPTWAGGITESKKIATMAETYKRPVAMHDCTGPFTLFAGVHLAINATNAVYQESLRSYLRITYPNLVTEIVRVEDGHILAPTAPGLGTTLLPEVRTRPDVTVVASTL